MDESTTSPAPASEEGQGSDPAASGGESGTPSTSDTFEAERSALEARARGFQSEADKLRAELDAARAQLKPKADEAEGRTDEPAPVDLVQIRREAAQGAFLAHELIRASASLQDEFPDASEEIFSRLDRYESVESLREAAAASNARFADVRAKAEAEAEAKYRELYSKQAGRELGPPDPENTTPTGDPTLADLSRMSMDELDALPEGTIERVEKAAGLR